MFASAMHAEFHDACDLLTESNTSGAVNTAGHLFGRDERTHRLVKDHPFFFHVTGGRWAIANSEVLELTLAALIADGAIQGVVDEQELHDTFLGLPGLVCLRVDLHARGYRGRTGRQGLGCLFDFNQAHAAVGRDRKLLVITEVRHVNAQLVGGVHDHAASGHLYLLTIDLKFNHVRVAA